MENIIYILFILVLFVVFVIFGAMYMITKLKFKQKIQHLNYEKQQLETDYLKHKNVQEEKETKIIQLNNEIIQLKENIANLTATCQQQEKQLKLENDILNVVKKEFSSIAADTIKKEQDDLIKNNQTAVKVSLEPFNKQLETFKQEITNYKDSHTKNTGEISQKLAELSQKSVQLNETALNLSNALTKNKNVKGWYGEDLAKTILEKSGFIEGIHFVAQQREETTTEKTDKKIAIPDYEIFLPDNRNLVIDAKAILSSIVNLQEAQDEELAQKEVFDAVKARIDELSGKKYENIKGLRQPEFVIMYIPIEPIVNLLYTSNKGIEIINYSRKNNIVITGSASLVTIINLINWIWKENDRMQNLDKIIAVGTKLYESVAFHAEEINKIQKSLNDAKQFTDDTIKRLSSSKSKYNIFREAEKLKTFGITSQKVIPNNLLDEEVNV